MVRHPRKSPAKPKSKTAVPVIIWGGEQDEAERLFIDCYAGGIAYDTETTGLTVNDEVTEIALVRIHDGEVLFESRVRPHKARMSEEAQHITGISDAMLKKAPYWEELEPELLRIIGDQRLVAWSGERVGDRPFDSRLCQQSHDAAGLGHVDQPFFHTNNIKYYHRRLRQKAYLTGVAKDVRGGLARAMAIEGLQWTGKQHGALVDAKAVAAVVKACLHINDKEQEHGQERSAAEVG